MIHPLLDLEKQGKARQYEKEKRLFGLVGTFLSFIFLAGFYGFGFSRRLAFGFDTQPLWIVTILYLVIFQLLTTVWSLPWQFLSGYRHEVKWDFSTQSAGDWFLDQLKALAIGLVLMPLLIGLLIWVMTVSPDFWWLIAGLAVAVVGVIFATLFPIIILPIFNKYTPVDNVELVSRLKILLDKSGLKPSGFFVEDMSRRTKKENAFLAGLGKTRRVVLGDTLLENMTIPEIESVIAHEVGHYRHRHIWKNIALGTVVQIGLFYLLDLALTAMFPEFLTGLRWNLTLLPVFLILFSLISGIGFTPGLLALSRYFERQADRTALELTENRLAFQTAMAGLANRNLSNAYPARWVKLLYYSHPPIGERLEFAENSS